MYDAISASFVVEIEVNITCFKTGVTPLLFTLQSAAPKTDLPQVLCLSRGLVYLVLLTYITTTTTITT